MLTACPIKRIVDMVEEATPLYLRGTELMMALVLGVVNIPVPIPIRIMMIISCFMEVSGLRKISKKSAAKEKNIPREERILASILSDKTPESGAQIIITAGMIKSISPAVCELICLIICKNSDSKKTIPKVAL